MQDRTVMDATAAQSSWPAGADPAAIRAMVESLESFPVSKSPFSTADAQALRSFLGQVRQALGLHVGFVSRFRAREREFLVVEAASGFDGLLQEGDSDPLDGSYCGLVASGAVPQVIPDALDHPVLAAMPATHAAGVRAHVSVPVKLPDGRVFGTVCCFGQAPKPDLTDDDASALRDIAEAIAASVRSDGSIKSPIWN